MRLWLVSAVLGCQDLLVRVDDSLADEVGYSVAQRLLELSPGAEIYYSVRPSFDLEFLRMAVVSVCASPVQETQPTSRFELTHHQNLYVVAPAEQQLPFATDDPAPDVMDLILQHVRTHYTDAEWSSDFHKDFVKSSSSTSTTAPKYFRGPIAERN